MAKKRVNITIDEYLANKWSNVAEQLGWSKSAMVQEFLEAALDYIEERHLVKARVQYVTSKKCDERSSVLPYAD